MEISEEPVGDVYVVTAQGRLDGTSSAKFLERFEPLTSGANPKLLIDLSGIDFVTSAGLRAVLGVVKRVKAANGLLAVCGLQAPVREILDITGLTPMMQIYPLRADGLVALSK
jgi:anti-anti-sigma factor